MVEADACESGRLLLLAGVAGPCALMVEQRVTDRRRGLRRALPERGESHGSGWLFRRSERVRGLFRYLRCLRRSEREDGRFLSVAREPSENNPLTLCVIRKPSNGNAAASIGGLR